MNGHPQFRIPVTVLLCTVAALVETVHLSSLSSLSSADLWWHLRTGLWILENHALPHTGLFSQSSDLPWIASSWSYDLLLAAAYRVLDLRAIPDLLMCFKAALAVATFFLAGGARGDFWPAVALSALAQYLLAAVQPGPAYCSILFFAVELLLLSECRRTASLRPLFWLPPLFLLWANVDVQFVYGLALLLLFLIASALEEFGRRFRTPGVDPARHPVPLKIAGITALSFLATLITPYFFQPWGVFFSTVSSAANQYLPDFHAMRFHQPQDYFLLLLTMAAFLALGLRRSRNLYLILLLAFCAALSFHAQRDLWLVTLAALTVLCECINNPTRSEVSTTRARSPQALATSAAIVLILILAVALRIPRNHETLLAKVGQTYPVAACTYIREHNLPQPLFNSYEWGGFLTWYLPDYPVAIDSRAGLYGDDVIVQYSKVMNAELPYQANSALAGAQTLLLHQDSLMGEALSTMPKFKVAYRDDVAVVLTRR